MTSVWNSGGKRNPSGTATKSKAPPFPRPFPKRPSSKTNSPCTEKTAVGKPYPAFTGTVMATWCKSPEMKKTAKNSKLAPHHPTKRCIICE